MERARERFIYKEITRLVHIHVPPKLLLQALIVTVPQSLEL